MKLLLRSLPLVAALAAAPAFAAQPAAHAEHHPEAAATTADKSETTQGCPAMNGAMMSGQMGGGGQQMHGQGAMSGMAHGGAMMGGQMGANGSSGMPMNGQDHMAGMGHGKMSMDGQGVHCPQAPAAPSDQAKPGQEAAPK